MMYLMRTAISNLPMNGILYRIKEKRSQSQFVKIYGTLVITHYTIIARWIN